MTQRAILLGMNNPISGDPDHVLYPHPVNCSGWRLWKLLNGRTGASKAGYLRAFERRNLVDGRAWNVRAAREALPALLRLAPGRTLVPLGAEVRQVLGLTNLLIEPQELHGATWRCLPHPSGRCLWWNDKDNRDAAALLLDELAALGRGAPEEG